MAEKRTYDNGTNNIILEDVSENKKLKKNHEPQNLADAAGVPKQIISQIKHKHINSQNFQENDQTQNGSSYVSIDHVEQTASLINDPEKKKREKKFPHIIYLTPSGDESSKKMVIKIAKIIKKKISIKVFIIFNKDFVLNNNNFEEKQITSKDEIIDMLLELNKDLSGHTIKRFKIIQNDILCYATLMHSGNYLCKNFGGKIEDESIKEFLSIAGLKRIDNHSMQNSENSDGSYLPEETLSVEEPILCQKEDFYDTQKKIGEHILKMIEKKLAETNLLGSEEEVSKHFEDFHFIILLPNRISLESQTKSRLEDVKKYPKCHINDKDISRVIRICENSSRLKSEWKEFIEEAKKKPEQLYLVIHDECHWGSGADQSAFKFLGFHNGDYHYTEPKKILPNLFTLMVSATPYNIYPLIKDQDKVIDWKKFFQTTELGGDYFGLTKLRENTKIFSDNTVELSHDYDTLLTNGFSKEFICVINDYVNDLKNIKEPGNNTSTIARCISEKKLVVIRVGKTCNNVSQSSVIGQVLKEAIQILNLKIEVCINDAENDKQDFAFPEHSEMVMKRIRKRTKKIDITGEKLDFSDIINIPMVMVIIERGRMGDTFPKNCIQFDLRARYLMPVKDFTCIIQDVGRAFGYSDRPCLILSKEADDFLKNIWDSETDSLSEKNLKIKLGIRLGNHMKRKKTAAVKENHKLAYEDDELLSKEETESEESEEVTSDLELVRKIFESDPKKRMFLYNLVPEAFEHRLILKAEPQNGKTGAFLYLIKLLSEKIRPKAWRIVKSQLSDFTKKFYSDYDNDQIENIFKTVEGQAMHKEYIELLTFSRQKRQKENILEPAQWAAWALVQHLTKYNTSKTKYTNITIADFGCGDNQFSTFLVDEIKNSKLLQNIDIKIFGYDYTTNVIAELANLPLNVHFEFRYANCAKECNFAEESFDFVISTCALFGKGDSWKHILKTALYALKSDGILFLAETRKKKNQPGIPDSDLCIALGLVNVSCEFHKSFGSKERKKLFLKKYLAMTCTKDEDYEHGQLLDELRDIIRDI